MTTPNLDETTPDQLLETFRGRSLKSIIVFTIAVHAVLLLGTSIPFLWRTLAGADSSTLSEEARIELAMKEATASLRDIAEQHGLKPQDLSSQFGSGTPRARNPPPATEPETRAPGADTPAAPAQPESAIEKELDKTATGPAVPPIPKDDGEDLFK